MPWLTLCGFPPTASNVTLRVPNGAWRPDTVITDWDGNEMFVLLDQTNEMRSYEAIFGDLMGRRLVCVKRHLTKAFWKDGYYFCTYQPNYKGQKALPDKDVDKKKVYPFSYVEIDAMKGRFTYRLFDDQGKTGKPRMSADNPWLGFMVVCCTPMMGWGKWTARFKKNKGQVITISVDQWRNVVEVGPGNDLLAALCLAYIFDRYQNQPLITVFGRDEDDLAPDTDDHSIMSDDDNDPNKRKKIELSNLPDNDEFKDHDDDDDLETGSHGKGHREPEKEEEQEEEEEKDGDRYYDGVVADDYSDEEDEAQAKPQKGDNKDSTYPDSSKPNHYFDQDNYNDYQDNDGQHYDDAYYDQHGQQDAYDQHGVYDDDGGQGPNASFSNQGRRDDANDDDDDSYMRNQGVPSHYDDDDEDHEHDPVRKKNDDPSDSDQPFGQALGPKEIV